MPHHARARHQLIAVSKERLHRHKREEETNKIFELGGAFYPGYPKYRVRADHREIRVFVLEAAT